MIKIAEMYITLMPAILAGILNMLWCKIKAFDFLKKPIDLGKNAPDGKRIFGDNKTFKGFIGMIIFGALLSLIWGEIMKTNEALCSLNYFYRNYSNNVAYNLLIGTLTGFAYALFELPNSFLKRRLDITPGKNDISGAKRFVFIFLDQADSVFGCVLVVCLFYPMPVWYYLLYVLVGSLTHIIMNVLLYFLKLRKNMF